MSSFEGWTYFPTDDELLKWVKAHKEDDFLVFTSVDHTCSEHESITASVHYKDFCAENRSVYNKKTNKGIIGIYYRPNKFIDFTDRHDVVKHLESSFDDDDFLKKAICQQIQKDVNCWPYYQRQWPLLPDNIKDWLADSLDPVVSTEDKELFPELFAWKSKTKTKTASKAKKSKAKPNKPNKSNTLYLPIKTSFELSSHLSKRYRRFRVATNIGDRTEDVTATSGAATFISITGNYVTGIQVNQRRYRLHPSADWTLNEDGHILGVYLD